MATTASAPSIGTNSPRRCGPCSGRARPRTGRRPAVPRPAPRSPAQPDATLTGPRGDLTRPGEAGSRYQASTGGFAVRHSVPARETLDQAVTAQVASVPTTHHPASVSPTASASDSPGTLTCSAGAVPGATQVRAGSRPSQSPRATWMRLPSVAPAISTGPSTAVEVSADGGGDQGVAEDAEDSGGWAKRSRRYHTMAAFRATSSTTQTTTYRLRTRRPPGLLLRSAGRGSRPATYRVGASRRAWTSATCRTSAAWSPPPPSSLRPRGPLRTPRRSCPGGPSRRAGRAAEGPALRIPA